jgi:hypothetical protein
MKEATILLKLSKDHSVTRHNVTPIEVMILCAEHQANVKDVPVEVDEKSITEVTEVTQKEVENPHKPGTKRMDLVRVPSKRSLDDELDRLRARYGSAKVKVLLAEVRDIPQDDFKAAIARGMKLTLPSSQLSQTKVI